MSIYAKTLAAALCLIAFNIEAVPAQAPASGCSRDKGYYFCNKSQFTTALKNAGIVSIETHPFNQISTKALEDLARGLGKSVQSDSAQLTFVLAPGDAEGLYFGPNDRELARLSVFSRGPKGELGQLIWVESFIGQPDMSWPVVVRGLIQQFKADLK